MENTERIEEQVTEVETTEETKKKKTRAPKARTLEELKDCPVKKMTEKEKEIYIGALEEALNESITAAESFKKLAENALKEKNEIQNILDSIDARYQQDFKYISSLVQSMGNAIIRVTGGVK